LARISRATPSAMASKVIADQLREVEMQPHAATQTHTDDSEELQQEDIEHVHVEDDPRKWSAMRKV
jgi:hypothetical protein